MKQMVYIFDVDGVLNDLHNYDPDERIIGLIAELLDGGTFVAINTGRGYDWVRDDIIRALRGKLDDVQSLGRLFVSAEMGGLGIEFVGGKEVKTRSAFSLTYDQIEEVRKVFEQYSDKVHWYEGKESMATIAKLRDGKLEDFRPVQRELTALLQDVFKGRHVKVANSNDAVDVHAPEAGKWAGAQLIYEWLRRTTDIKHDRFICFGDSLADYEMARFFTEQNRDTTFVLTNTSLDISDPHPGIEVVKTARPYKDGTYDYLSDHLRS
jgi:hydroxymethylpyrimidine pyrophosphatase-like HAD family hydrolase